MEPFLKEITRIIYSTYSKNLDSISIVVPNKRAKLYFNKYLSEIIDKPIFSPDLFTINELIDKFSKLRSIDDLTLTFKLYQVFKKHLKSSESFDEFYYWGQMLLGDFNDIDNNIVNAQKVFTYISDIKEIENIFDYLTPKQIDTIKSFWKSFNTEKISKQQDDFLEIWKELYQIYIEFNTVLSDQNLAYQGMVYKDAINNFTLKYYKENINYRRIIFVGFNALNKTEKKLFNFLKDEKLADFYWDYDEYYINNKIHEANYFLKENIVNFKTDNNINYKNLVTNKNIDIVSTPSNIGQAKLISKFLNEFKENNDFDINKTAIVLADESLLIPVLNSIPEYIEHVNITMGFPISETPAFLLFNNLIELQQTQSQQNSFYYKSVKNIIEHSYIASLFHEDAKQISKNIIENNKIYLNNNELIFNDLYKLIFTNISETDNISDYINNIIHYISIEFEKIETTANKIIAEHLQAVYLTVKKIDEIIKASEITINIKTYLNILKTVIKTKTIPFEGEPLNGLQIMGILETRVLDFENLIILSLNEGLLPKTSSSSSFIPYNIRKGFGMPTIEHQDAVFGYYFYRLLHRSKNIKLVYNSNITSTNKEKSRFLTQIILENFANYKIKDLNFDVNITNSKEIIIEKNNEIQQKLSKYFIGGIKLSPSAINTYLNCSLMFYFKYIARIKEPKEVTEDIDPMQFGSIFHLAMEVLYKDFKEKNIEITSNEFTKILNNKDGLTKALSSAFAKIIFDTEITIDYKELEGKNILVYNVILDYIIKLIKNDIKKTPFKIIDLEGKYYLPITIEVDGEKQIIKTGGSIDRIDFKDNFYYILDYKTGSADAKFSSIEELFDETKEKRPKEVMQTFIYTIAFMNDQGIDNAIPGVLQILKVFSEDFSSYIYLKKDRGKYPITDFTIYKDEFTETLSEKISNIFNKNVAFTQTIIVKHCEYCPYKNICHR
jgi:RecB family exonuclease